MTQLTVEAVTHLGVISVGQPYDALAPDEIVTGTAEGSANGRARILGAEDSLLHVYAECSSGRLLGAAAVCAGGEHLAHLLAWSLQHNLTVDDILQLPFYHPVVEEGLRSALQAARRALGKRRVTPDLPMCEEPAAWALGGD